MKTIVLGDIIREIVEKTTINNQHPVLTSSQSGLVSQGEYFNKQIASQDNTGYKIIRKGQFTYRAMSDTGRFYINQSPYEIGIVSPAYPVFEIIEDGHVLPEYIATYFRSDPFQNAIALQSTGSTRVSLKLGKIKDISIDIPSVSEQKEILENINEVESLIGSRREQLEKLDELVKSRFIELFGDVTTNPYGYKIKNFDEISILITDGEHATPRRTEKGIYLLSARNVLNHALQLDNVDYIDEDEYNRIARRIIPQAGDVLISCSGSIGRCCIVPEGLKFQMVRSAALIRFNETINPIFAEWLITSDDLQQQIAQSATQSSQANLFQGKIRKLHGYVPPIELQNQFAVFVEQTDKSKLAIQESLAELETLKKALMQKYFG